MGYKRMFRDLIAEGGYTKTYLISRLNDIRSFNTQTNIILSDEEYNEIVALINASSLQ